MPVTAPLSAILQLLRRHRAEAADAVLLEAVRLGNDEERERAIDLLLQRNTRVGTVGLIRQYDELPTLAAAQLLSSADKLGGAIARCGRSESPEERLAAIALINRGRLPRLAYVLGEAMNTSDARVRVAAAEALAELAAEAATGTRRLQAGELTGEAAERLWKQVGDTHANVLPLVVQLIESGAESGRLVRAAIAGAGRGDSPVIHAMKNNGRTRSSVEPNLRHPDSPEAARSLVAAAAAGPMRQKLAAALSRLDKPVVLEGLLELTYWLKDAALQQASKAIDTGRWWHAKTLARDVEEGNLSPERAADVADWLLASAIADEELLLILVDHVNSPVGKLRLMRSAISRGASVRLLSRLLDDEDERVARMAARELARHPDSAAAREALLRRAATARPSVREVINRFAGAATFDSLWQRWPRLGTEQRLIAARAAAKLTPDLSQRLRRHLLSGRPDDSLRAMQVAESLELLPKFREAIGVLCEAPHPHVRSRAVWLLGRACGDRLDDAAITRIESALSDQDARVRANAVEVLESAKLTQLAPLLSARATMGRNRERANAIKALSSLRLADPRPSLFGMLRDTREAHRISALWAVEKTGAWKLLDEVARIARADTSPQVRRGAVDVIRRVAERMRQRSGAA